MNDIELVEDGIVKRYQRWHRTAGATSYKRLKGLRIAEILKRTGPPLPSIVELGVGPGAIASTLRSAGMSVTGIDLSPEALTRASAFCHGMGINFVRASGFTLPLRDGSVDVLLCSQVLHLFDEHDKRGLMREAIRVLKPGGRFVFDIKTAVTHPVQYMRRTPTQRARIFTPATVVVGLLQAQGFQSTTLWPGLLPGLRVVSLPRWSVLRTISHTVFYVATK